MGLAVCGRTACFQPEEEETVVLSTEFSALEAHLNLSKAWALRAAYAAWEAEQQKNSLANYLTMI